MTVRPRGWLEAFLIVAAPSGLAFGIGWKVLTDTPAQDSTVIGLVFGAIVGLIGAAKYREEQVIRTVADPATFVSHVHDRLVELGFQLGAETASYRFYQTASQGSFSLGAVSLPGLQRRVRLKVDGSAVTIVAPRDVIAALATT
jgi:hypothetical protein